MAVAKGSSPAELLQEWLADDRLKSQYSALETQINSGGYSHYAVMAQREGWDVVKAELDARRARDFAACIASVASGMFALASVDTKHKYVTIGDDNAIGTVLPTRYELSSPSQLVVMTNRADDYQTFGRLDSIFAPDGSYGLKAVALRVGRDRLHGNPAAVLDLVLPRWMGGSSTAPPPHVVDAYVVVSVELNGLTNAHAYDIGFCGQTYLERGLGINNSRYQMIGCSETMGSSVANIDGIVGYPGVLNTLANDLRFLPQYYEAMAEKLGCGR